jgi:hypothetical protein
MKTNSLAPLDSQQRYTIPESLAYLRTSRATIYELIATGKLATITEGRRRYVPGAAIIALSRPAT